MGWFFEVEGGAVERWWLWKQSYQNILTFRAWLPLPSLQISSALNFSDIGWSLRQLDPTLPIGYNQVYTQKAGVLPELGLVLTAVGLSLNRLHHLQVGSKIRNLFKTKLIAHKLICIVCMKNFIDGINLSFKKVIAFLGLKSIVLLAILIARRQHIITFVLLETLQTYGM